jgi:hypothetical protein
MTPQEAFESLVNCLDDRTSVGPEVEAVRATLKAIETAFERISTELEFHKDSRRTANTQEQRLHAKGCIDALTYAKAVIVMHTGIQQPPPLTCSEYGENPDPPPENEDPIGFYGEGFFNYMRNTGYDPMD